MSSGKRGPQSRIQAIANPAVFNAMVKEADKEMEELHRQSLKNLCLQNIWKILSKKKVWYL